MKIFNAIIFYFLFSVSCVYCSDVYVSDATKCAENLFRQNVELQEKMIFFHVPRGLIVSIDDKIFFDFSEEKLKRGGIPYLEQIAGVLNQLDNNFVIEGHTKDAELSNCEYLSNWELSLARANNITKYLIRYAHINPKKIFTIGFGEFMPLGSKVSLESDFDNRIDFVILDYKASR